VTRKLGVVALAGPDHGGTYQYTLSMLHGLQHVRDFEITIYGNPDDAGLVGSGFPIVRFSEPYARQAAALAAHRLHLRLPDPFTAEDVLLAPIYSLSLLHTSRPFAYTLHDLQEWYYPENFSRLQRIWRYQVHAALLSCVGRVICESRYVKNDIVHFFGIPEAQAAVITAPPQKQFIERKSAQELDATRQRLQLPARFLFYPAQFWIHKNHLRLVAAFAQVVKEFPDLGLVLTGQQRDQYQPVMAAVDRLGLHANVQHLGHIEQNDLHAVYQLATVLVMPSVFESVSIPIYEAFLAGVPVAASDIFAISEQVGDAGVLFDPTSVASIRDAVTGILRDLGASKRLGERGRERMQAMTPARYGEQLQQVLGELGRKKA
jgi:glycosyltransferase involved in cell wall biosynthesis